jgi:hypothetical protein
MYGPAKEIQKPAWLPPVWPRSKQDPQFYSAPGGPLYRQALAVIAVLLVSSAVAFAGNTYIVPTTTLAAQTSNNTSAADNFSSQTNGNRGAGNVSKVDVHSLLYSGATTKTYAHLLLWFGPSNHINVGYSSTDPAQIARQITDMIGRGINGVIIDWYGPNNSIDQATLLVMAEAEKHPGFTFAIAVDQGAIKWDSCTGCTPQQALVSQMQYVEQTYFPSPAYMTQQGQPVVTNFDIDLAYQIDWNAVNASLSTHPLFLFQNNSGFSHVLSGGSFSWVIPTTTDYGMSYLSSFYSTGMTFPSEQTVAATYKGFNDTLASWGSNRIMGQQCGQTWLQTFSEINGLYSSGKQVPALQLVTWNDYEEGTEIESGIDNCLTLSSSVAANALQWTVKGDESTVDHYTVYISSDGQNLMSLTDMAAGLHSLNLCSFPIPGGNYKLFVQAVGKPSLVNQITGAINYAPACGSGGGSSTVSLSASPSAVTIPSGKSGSLTVTAQPQSGSFNSPIALSCAGIPSTLSCSFSPATITPGADAATSTLTISLASVSGATLPQRSKSTPLYAAWLLPLGIAGFAFIGSGPSRRAKKTTNTAVLAFLCLCITLASVSCGGGTGTTPNPPTANNYSVTINGSSSDLQLTTTIIVTVP